MQWLLHGVTTTAVADALVRHGHLVHRVADLNLAPEADLAQVLTACQSRRWDILTADAALAAAPFDHDLPFNRTIVYLQLGAGQAQHNDAIDRLFQRYRRLCPRRLYTVTASRVKVRQLPAPT
jgi:hypothetical protein